MATLAAILQIEFGRVPGHSHPSFGVRHCLCKAPGGHVIGLFCVFAGCPCPGVSGRYVGGDNGVLMSSIDINGELLFNRE